jgi:hypothetical protein
MKAMDEDNDPMPKWMEFVESVMKPLCHCQGQSWISCGLDGQIEPSLKKAKRKEYTSSTVGSKPYSEFHFSPNVLSLFLETRADPVLQKVHMMSPRVNHRNLHHDRVWNSKSSENPGVIGTLLGLANGETQRDKSLSENDYHIFPYTVKERSEGGTLLSDSDLVFSEHVFSHQKDLNNTTRIVTHIDACDVKRLLNILELPVCKDCFHCVNKLMLYLITY